MLVVTQMIFVIVLIVYPLRQPVTLNNLLVRRYPPLVNQNPGDATAFWRTLNYNITKHRNSHTAHSEETLISQLLSHQESTSDMSAVRRSFYTQPGSVQHSECRRRRKGKARRHSVDGAPPRRTPTPHIRGASTFIIRLLTSTDGPRDCPRLSNSTINASAF